MRKKNIYQFKNFAWDILMFVATGGLWTIWIIIREFQIQKR